MVYKLYKLYVCLTAFLISDFLVRDPPPAIFFRHLLVKDLFSRYKWNTRKIPISGTFSNVLESTVRNRLFGRRLFFILFDIHLLRTILLRSIRVEPQLMRLHFEKNIFVVSLSPRARPFAFNHLGLRFGFISRAFRRGKLLGFGQNASETIP